MPEEKDEILAGTLDVKPPFTFGLGIQGELQISFFLSGVKLFLVIPAEEVETLRLGRD
jgi:hypothetical protein